MQTETATCFISHLERFGNLLQVWVQKDHGQALFIEDSLLRLKSDLQYGGNIPRSMDDLRHGLICAAKFDDGSFYRTQIQHPEYAPVNAIPVLFIDYGNVSLVGLGDIRLFGREEHDVLIRTPPLAIPYFLAGISITEEWKDENVAWIKHKVQYTEQSCTLYHDPSGVKLITIPIDGSDLAQMVVANNLGVRISNSDLVVIAAAIVSNVDVTVVSEPVKKSNVALRLNKIVKDPSPKSSRITSPVEFIPSGMSPHCTVEKLVEGSSHNAYVSHVEDGPLSFCIQLKKDADELLPKLIEMLKYSIPSPNKKPLVPGSWCLGRCTLDQGLRRGVVMSMHVMTCKVYYMDYGDVEELPHSEIYQMSPNIAALPPLALHFGISSIHESEITAGMKMAFKDLVLNKQVIIRVNNPPLSSPAIQHCDMFLGGRSIMEIMPKKDSRLFFTPQSPPRVRDMKTRITFVEDASNFFVQYCEDETLLVRVQEAVSTYCALHRSALKPGPFDIDTPVAALYQEDNTWYRAKIMQASQEMAVVFYVDFGNLEMVTWNCVVKLPREIVEMARALAARCRLMDVDVSNESMGTEALQSLNDEPVTLRLQCIDTDGKLVVDIITPQGHSIAQLLKPRNLGTTIISNQKLTVTQDGHKRTVIAGDTSPTSRYDNKYERPQERERDKIKKSHYMTQEENRFEENKFVPSPNTREQQQQQPYRKSYYEHDNRFEEMDKGDSAAVNNTYERKNNRNQYGAGGDTKRSPYPRENKTVGRSEEKNWKNDIGEGRRENKWKDKETTNEISGSGGNWDRNYNKEAGKYNRDRDQNQEGGRNDGRDNRYKLRQEEGNDNRYKPRQDEGNERRWNSREDGGDRRGGRRNMGNDNAGGGDNRGPRFGGDDRGQKYGENRAPRFGGDEGSKFGVREERGPRYGGDDRGQKFGEGGRYREDRGHKTGGVDDRGYKSGGGKWGGENKKWGGEDGGRKTWQSRDDDRPNRKWQTRDDNNEYNKRADDFQKSRSKAVVATGKVEEEEAWDDQDTKSPASVQVAPSVSEYPVFTLEPGMEIIVRVSHVLSPAVFYVQGLDSNDELDTLRNIIDADTKVTSRPVSESLQCVGTPVLARFSEDQLLYRGVIKQAPVNSSASVLFVDYGNAAAISYNELFLPTEEMGIAEAQAVRCSLADVQTILDAWNKLTQETSEGYFMNAEFLVLRIEQVNYIDGELTASVILTQPDGITVSEILVKNTVANPIEGGLLPASVSDPDLPRKLVKSSELASWKANFASKIKVRIPQKMIDSHHEDEWTERLDLLVGQYLRIEVVDIVGQGLFHAKVTDCPLEVLCTVGEEQKIDSLEAKTKGIMFIKAVLQDRLHVKLYNLEGNMINDGPPIAGSATKILPVVPAPVIHTLQTVIPIYVQGKTVFLQKASDSDEIAEFLERLYNAYQETEPSNITWKSGDLCCANSEDGNWYRARIIDQKFTVQYIDYGNTEIVAAAALRPILPEFTSLPEFAVKAQLSIMTPDSDISELILNQELKAHFMKGISSENWFVQLLDDKGNDIVSGIKSVEIKEDPDSPFIEINSVIGSRLGVGSRVPVVIAHIDSPSSFWAHLSAHVEAIENLQTAIQNIEPKGDVGPIFTARFAADETWYRAVWVDSTCKKVRFIDYGNIDDVTLIKPLPREYLRPLSGYAVPMTLNVYPVGGTWSPAAFDLFDSFVDVGHEETIAEIISVHFKIVVDLKIGGKSVSQVLVEAGHATYEEEDHLSSPLVPKTSCDPLTTLEPSHVVKENVSNANTVFVAHSNSVNDFYVTRVDDTGPLENICDVLAEADNFDVLKSVKESELVVAQFPEDEQWYRARIMSVQKNINVIFIDYGNSSVVTQVRKLPTEYCTTPPFAVHCSLGVENPTDETENKFMEMYAQGATQFTLKIDKEGDPHLVTLILNGESILNSILSSATASQVEDVNEKSSSLVAELTTFPEKKVREVFVCYSEGPDKFFVQDSTLTDLNDLIIEILIEGNNFAQLTPKVGDIIAAYSPDNGGCWYRGIVLSVQPQIEVRFIDYGNSSVVTDVRELPLRITTIPALASCCCLEKPYPDMIWTAGMREKFNDIINEGFTKFEMTVVKDGDVKVVQLVLNGISVVANLIKYAMDHPTSREASSVAPLPKVEEIKDEQVKKVYISVCESPDRFYVQEVSKSNELDELAKELLPAPTFQPITSLEVGGLIAAKFRDDEIWYRAEILATEPAVSVRFIDYGNSSEVEEYMLLPEGIAHKPPVAVLCSLHLADKGALEWGSAATERFLEMVSEGTTEFDMEIIEEGEPKLVKLMLNGINVIEELLKLNSQIIEEAANFNEEQPNLLENTEENAVEVPVEVFENVKEDKVQMDLTEIEIEEDVITELEGMENEGKKVYISHVQGLDKFWVQKDSLSQELEELANKLIEEAENYARLENINEKDIVIANFPDDGGWYRALVLCTQPEMKVRFIDYGNSSTVTECRAIPENLAAMVPFAVCCSLQLPEGKNWTSKAKDKFDDFINGEISSFRMEVLKEGEPQIIDLFVDGHSIMEELLPYCETSPEKPSSIEEQVNTNSTDIELEEEAVNEEEEFEAEKMNKVFVSHVESLQGFYIQRHCDIARVHEVSSFLGNSESLEKISDPEVGDIVCAQFADDLQWYRCSVTKKGTKQHTIRMMDFGMEMEVLDIRKLPSELQNIPPLAEHCRLEIPPGIDSWSPDAESRFIKIVGEGSTLLDIEFLNEKTEPKTVVLSIEGKDISQELIPLSIGYSDSNKVDGIAKVTVSQYGDPSSFYIVEQDSIPQIKSVEAALEEADNFKKISDPKVGKKVCAKVETGWKRALIVSTSPQINVFLMDIGSIMTTSDVRELPDDLKRLPPFAKNCKIQKPASLDSWPAELKNKFKEFVNEGNESGGFELVMIEEGKPACIVDLLHGSDSLYEILIKPLCQRKQSHEDKLVPGPISTGSSLELTERHEYKPQTNDERIVPGSITSVVIQD